MLPEKEITKIFPQFSEAELIKSISLNSKFLKVEENEMLMDIGQYIKVMPLVISGTIKIMREDEEGNELLLYYLTGGHTCALSLSNNLDGDKSKIRAVTETEASILMIPIRFMDEWISKFPSWRNYVLSTYAMRFEELLSALDSIAFVDLDNRLLNYLQEKRLRLKQSTLQITHQQIASDLHSSREVISRLLKKLEKMGHVELGRNQIILKQQDPT